MLRFVINDQLVETDMPSGTILIDFIREALKLTGTKEACREGECGACTVLVGSLDNKSKISYKSCASCILPIGEVKNCHIVTVEGVNFEKNLNIIQQLIMNNSASQCGFCTPGIVLSLTGFCLTSKDFSYDGAIDSLDGNLCRCTGYVSIRNVARGLSETLKGNNKETAKRVKTLVSSAVLPEYFLKIPEMLKDISSESSGKLSKNSIIVAGGTDLFVQRPEQLQELKLFFVSERKDLNYIKENKTHILIGGAVNVEDFRNSEVINKYVPVMKRDLLYHSSMILRNKATFAGNIVNASPIGDMTIILLALNATLVIECKGGGMREVALDKFYKGYKKFDLEKCEIIKEIKIPIPKGNYYYNFEKVSNRKILDIAAVNSALFMKADKNGKIEDLRISAGGVAPVPFFIQKLDSFKGEIADKNTILKIADKAAEQVTPIDDIRGSAKYKKLLLKELVVSHFKKLFGPKVYRMGYEK